MIKAWSQTLFHDHTTIIYEYTQGKRQKTEFSENEELDLEWFQPTFAKVKKCRILEF